MSPNSSLTSFIVYDDGVDGRSKHNWGYSKTIKMNYSYLFCIANIWIETDGLSLPNVQLCIGLHVNWIKSEHLKAQSLPRTFLSESGVKLIFTMLSLTFCVIYNRTFVLTDSHHGWQRCFKAFQSFIIVFFKIYPSKLI